MIHGGSINFCKRRRARIKDPAGRIWPVGRSLISSIRIVAHVWHTHTGTIWPDLLIIATFQISVAISIWPTFFLEKKKKITGCMCDCARLVCRNDAQHSHLFIQWSRAFKLRQTNARREMGMIEITVKNKSLRGAPF